MQHIQFFHSDPIQCTTSQATTTTTTIQASLFPEELAVPFDLATIRGDLAPMIIPIIHPEVKLHLGQTVLAEEEGRTLHTGQNPHGSTGQ